MSFFVPLKKIAPSCFIGSTCTELANNRMQGIYVSNTLADLPCLFCWPNTFKPFLGTE
jgi:hypothetical protein